MSYPVEIDEHGNAIPPLGEQSPAQRLRRRFLNYAKKLEREDPQLAKRIREKVGDIVKWYLENRRDMTPEALKKEIGE